MCGSVTSQPDEAYLQGNSTELATFSMARFLMEPRGPLQVGQQVSLGRQLEHTCKAPEGQLGGTGRQRRDGRGHIPGAQTGTAGWAGGHSRSTRGTRTG